MGALARPDIPPGPQRELNDALHDLHHRAGRPSLRTLARHAACSPTTVSAAFSTPRLPSWGLLELIVEAMDGDRSHFHQLWLTASNGHPDTVPSVTAIAGRRDELAAVRRHFETGTGLLLVTGEAGIGKTTLVTTAADSSGTFVATGQCLPLSTEVPLLPVADALRQLLDVDGGRWFREALTYCPAFVAGSLVSMLPELAPDSGPRPSDGFARQQMFAAAASVLDVLAEVRPLVLWFEDLHWADGATLDLLEHLVTRPRAVRTVGTWRTQDDSTSPATNEWFMRVRRIPRVAHMELGPLSREETAQQLALLGGRAAAAQVDTIHARSQGSPLFTEHLAAHGKEGGGLSGLLLDLLDRRLSGLDGDPWAIARVLGVAERPLTAAQLERATGLPPDRVITGLHVLHERRLLRAGPGETAELQHPLLAEALHRRLVPGEAPEVHRRLAELLGSAGAASPAEVAKHWQLAGDAAREVGWRVAAARDSADRYDWGQEAEHWLRVLDLWPEDVDQVGDPPITRAVAYLAAMDALRESLQWERAADMSEAAETVLGDVDIASRAELTRRAAEYRGEREGVRVGLGLIDEALDLYTRLPAGPGQLRALDLKRGLLMEVGRYDEALSLARAAARAATSVGDRLLHRHLLTSLAWHEGLDGAHRATLDLLAQGQALVPAGTDPVGDIRAAVMATDVLLMCGRPVEEVEQAARPGLAVAREWGIDSEASMILVSNLATAMLRAGLVARAEAVLADPPDRPPDPDRWAVDSLRASVDARKGSLAAAAERVRVALGVGAPDEIDLETLCDGAEIDFWRHEVNVTLPRLLTELGVVVDTAPVRILLPALMAAARGATEESLAGRGQSLDPVRDMVLRVTRRLSPADARDPRVRAHLATAAAELARAVRHDRRATWADAASGWERLTHPHDAAYCRWRAAQVALRDGQGTVAAKLLRRAARDAREHVPLSAAIAETAAYAQGP